MSYLPFDVSDKPISLQRTNLKRKLLEENGTNEWSRVEAQAAFEQYFSFVAESRQKFLEGKKEPWMVAKLPNVANKLALAMKVCFVDTDKPVGPSLLYKLYGYADLLEAMNIRVLSSRDREEADTMQTLEEIQHTKSMLHRKLEMLLERNVQGLWAFLYDFKCAYCPEESAFIQSYYRRPIV